MSEKAFPDGVSFGGGMDLRDYFAAQATGGVLMMIAAGQHQPAPDESNGADFIAASAYRIADAMLAARVKAREKTKP